MKLLAIESSTAVASVAVLVGSTVKAFATSTNQRAHSEFINPAIETCLKQASLQLADIDVFCCGQGPGSFTGIRVAANIVKSFSYLTGRPMATADSLSLLHFQNSYPGNHACIINAFKNRVYTSLYRAGEQVLAPCALTIPELETKVNELFGRTEKFGIFGDGYQVYETDFSAGLRQRALRTASPQDYPMAQALGLLALQKAQRGQTIEWKNFLPLYIRASEAEENLGVT